LEQRTATELRNGGLGIVPANVSTQLSSSDIHQRPPPSCKTAEDVVEESMAQLSLSSSSENVAVGSSSNFPASATVTDTREASTSGDWFSFCHQVKGDHAQYAPGLQSAPHTQEVEPFQGNEWTPTPEHLAYSEALECAICLEAVLQKPKRSDRRFGMLMGCEHVFCLKCLREWRAQEGDGLSTQRHCPICRELSYFVVPTTEWPQTPAHKHVIADRYKESLGKTPCYYFAQGEGHCPFGTSCFYLHAYPDGTLASRKPRSYTDADGEGHVVRQVRLSDFLEGHF